MKILITDDDDNFISEVRPVLGDDDVLVIYPNGGVGVCLKWSQYKAAEHGSD